MPILLLCTDTFSRTAIRVQSTASFRLSSCTKALSPGKAVSCACHPGTDRDHIPSHFHKSNAAVARSCPEQTIGPWGIPVNRQESKTVRPDPEVQTCNHAARKKRAFRLPGLPRSRCLLNPTGRRKQSNNIILPDRLSRYSQRRTRSGYGIVRSIGADSTTCSTTAFRGSLDAGRSIVHMFPATTKEERGRMPPLPYSLCLALVSGSECCFPCRAWGRHPDGSSAP